VVQRFIDTAKGVLLETARFFRTMAREGGIGGPLVYAVIGIVIGSLGSLLTRMMSPFGMMGGGIIRSFLIIPIVSICGLFIGSGILHVLLVLIAHAKQPFETTFRLVAYTVGSTSPFHLVPIIGSIVGAPWSLYVLIIGASEAHEVPQGQAAIAVLLPSVLCCILTALFWGAMMALMFGAIAHGLSS
jgi:hypothetical protein